MDAVRELIVRRAREVGESLRSLSLKLKKNHAYMDQFINRGTPDALSEKDRYSLASILQVSEAELRDPSLVGLGLPETFPQEIKRPPPRRLPDGQHTVPIFRQGQIEVDGGFSFIPDRVSDAEAPFNLAATFGAYAVYVLDDSMEPRYLQGELVFADPNRPARRGDFVIAQFAGIEGEPARAHIKRLAARDARAVHLEQLNPRKTLKFPAEKLVALHRIVMGGEG